MKKDEKAPCYSIHAGRPGPLGATICQKGIQFATIAEPGEVCSLLLYKKGCSEPEVTIQFPEEGKYGDIRSLYIEGIDGKKYEYNYQIGNRIVHDSYGTLFTGREKWGTAGLEEPHNMRARMDKKEFLWEGDAPLQLPLEEIVSYKLHVRGFTRHTSSKVKSKGTFHGIIEKIPYLKELGVNQVELMPVYEFSEAVKKETVRQQNGSLQMQPATGGERMGDPFQNAEETEQRINYWGYENAWYFAPKSSYSAGRDASFEFKTLVKALHKNGIEVILEFFFPREITPIYMLDCIRYWVEEYHIDGIHINQSAAVWSVLGRDPMLSQLKIYSEGFQVDEIYQDDYRSQELPRKRLAEYNDGFQITLRKFLKGDEGMLAQVAEYLKQYAPKVGYINYLANHNGFSMMDLVSYEKKHNELNGERNQDGSDYNYSWNCGVEGPSRKKKVSELRYKQLKNAWLMLVLAQGTPLIYHGDEMGKTKKGNNNTYCQDNELSWVNWNDIEKNRKIFDFVKKSIEFRRIHGVFHQKQIRLMDYKSLGWPDVSYHGEKAWYPQFEYYSRNIGIMYCGAYAEDQSFYVAYNMHWEPRQFALPCPEKGERWQVVIDSSKETSFLEGEEGYLEEQKMYLCEGRTIAVLMAVEDKKEKIKAVPGRKTRRKGEQNGTV